MPLACPGPSVPSAWSVQQLGLRRQIKGSVHSFTRVQPRPGERPGSDDTVVPLSQVAGVRIEKCFQRNPRSSRAAMRLPTGADLWPVAIFMVIFLLLVDLMQRRQRWAARYPPGPVPWPVLGNLPQIDFQNMPAGFQKVRGLLEGRRSHGDPYSEQVGGGETACWTG